MKRWAPFLIPFAAIVAAGVGAALILNVGEGSCEAWEEASIDGLDPHDQPCVRIDGTAHYTAVVRQTELGGLLSDDTTWYLFPLLAPGDLEAKEVHVVVRTTRAPERLVTYETMELAGRIEPSTPQIVPYATEIQLGKAGGYFFTDDLVVFTPDEVVSEGEVWRADAPDGEPR